MADTTPPFSTTELGLQKLLQDYLRACYVLFKSSFVYDTNNQALTAAAERVAAAANQIRADVNETASLELLAEGAYVNRTLLKLDPSSYEQADYLFAIFSTLGVSSVAAVDDTTATDWLDLIAVFKRCVGAGGEIADFRRTEHPRIQITAMDAAAGTSNAVAMTHRLRALRAYATTVIAVEEIVEAARTGRALRALRAKRSLQELIVLAGEASSLILALAHLKRHKLSLAHHLTNSAVFAVCLGRALGLDRSRICSLALSAVTHDVGRATTTDGDPRAGSVAERAFAASSVRALIGAPLASQQMYGRAVVACEVRRWVDRAAEPPGDDPYPFDLGADARLIAVVHAYSLLTTPRADRPGLLPDEALALIVRDAGLRFDDTAVRVLVNTLGKYPVGSSVALSDGRIAIVVDAPAADDGTAARPRIKIVRDRSGSAIDGEIVDLAADGRVRIERCVEAEDLELNAPAFLLS